MLFREIDWHFRNALYLLYLSYPVIFLCTCQLRLSAFIVFVHIIASLASLIWDCFRAGALSLYIWILDFAFKLHRSTFEYWVLNRNFKPSIFECGLAPEHHWLFWLECSFRVGRLSLLIWMQLEPECALHIPSVEWGCAGFVPDTRSAEYLFHLEETF